VVVVLFGSSATIKTERKMAQDVVMPNLMGAKQWLPSDPPFDFWTGCVVESGWHRAADWWVRAPIEKGHHAH
jgi:hypothetical protein